MKSSMENLKAPTPNDQDHGSTEKRSLSIASDPQLPPSHLLDEIAAQSKELGFDDFAVTAAQISQENIEDYLTWARGGKAADMDYMLREERCDPQHLLPGAKSAILFVSYYKKEKQEFIKGKGLLASYARSPTYQNVHRKRLRKFRQWFEERTGAQSKAFSDTSPIMEKALAVQAGLGWFGKNTLVIHRKFGTFFFLSGCLTTYELPHTLKLREARCGSCTRCIDHCPTSALSPYELDARRCLSYHTIESKKAIPQDIQEKNPGYVFGCDICQDVCPHNVRKKPSQSPVFGEENSRPAHLSYEELLATEPEALYGTPLQRKKKEGLLNTLASLQIPPSSLG